MSDITRPPFTSLRDGSLNIGSRSTSHTRQDAHNNFEMAERRAKVAALFKAHLTIREIAKEVGVGQGTVEHDLMVIREEWKEQYIKAAEEWIPLELAELDSMERDCALQFSATKHHMWLLRRLQIKERRAKMLGLDAPSKIDIRGWLAEQMRAAGATEEETRQAVSEVERMMRENPISSHG